MTISQISLWWLIGFIVAGILLIIVMLLRNKAAKTDSVNYTEKDTISQSVSLTDQKIQKMKLPSNQ